jgi:hypothetical protein
MPKLPPLLPSGAVVSADAWLGWPVAASVGVAAVGSAVWHPANITAKTRTAGKSNCLMMP